MSVNRSHLVLLALLSIALLVMFAACQKEAETAQTETPGVIDDSVAAPDGAMIHYDVRGRGDRTLVFIHCWCCNREFWRNQVEPFSQDYRVVTVDLGGHGESATHREHWTMEGFGQDVAAVVDKLDLHNAVLIGHSMGGTVMIEAARHLNGRLVGLVGVDNLQHMAQRFPEDQVDAYIATVKADFEGQARKSVAAMFTENADTALVRETSDIMASADPAMGTEALELLLKYDYAPALKEVRLPIRTISSDKYPTDVEGNRTLAASFDLRIMPNEGHFPHLEKPAEFNRLLTETLADFWPSTESD